MGIEVGADLPYLGCGSKDRHHGFIEEPLAISGNRPGNEIQQPMAIVILFGLTSSMILNMLIVPALYLRFGRPVARQEVG